MSNYGNKFCQRTMIHLTIPHLPNFSDTQTNHPGWTKSSENSEKNLLIEKKIYIWFPKWGWHIFCLHRDFLRKFPQAHTKKMLKWKPFQKFIKFDKWQVKEIISLGFPWDRSCHLDPSNIVFPINTNAIISGKHTVQHWDCSIYPWEAWWLL